MSTRRFRTTSVQRASHGPRQKAAELTCSRCREKDHVILAQHQMLPPEAIQQRFERAGWRVGRNDSHDVCPQCITADLKAKRERAATKPNDEAPMTIKPMIAAVPPRTMTRDDRRLIFAKLDEVYVSETEGYAPGWSDEKVAADLGTPRAWVETVRDENFGPLKDNAETRKLLAEVEELVKQVKGVETKAADLLRKAQEIRKAVA